MESVDKRVNVKLVTSSHSNGRKPGVENYIAKFQKLFYFQQKNLLQYR
jgi:hypothetical protein